VPQLRTIFFNPNLKIVEEKFAGYVIARLSISKKLTKKNKFGGISAEKFDTKKSFSFELGNSVLKFERLRIRRILEQNG
jgi:hypothetical protein